MSTIILTGSVGIKGKNKPADIKKVQVSLNKLASNIGLKNKLSEDGSIDQNPSRSKTVAAIKLFQVVSVGMSSPDGRIDVNGKSHKVLSEALQKHTRNDAQLPLLKVAPFSIIWPLKRNVIRRGIVNHTFGMVRTNRDGSARPHQGWDFEARVGTPCYAIATGRVAFVRETAAYGKQLCLSFIFNGKTHFAFYAHLQSTFLSKGDLVQIGEHIGYTGKSGNASGLKDVKDEHLHFEIRTVEHCGRGLGGRISPYNIYKKCPLKTPMIQSSHSSKNDHNSYSILAILGNLS